MSTVLRDPMFWLTVLVSVLLSVAVTFRWGR